MKMAGPLSKSSTGGGFVPAGAPMLKSAKIAPGAGPKVGLLGWNNRPNRLNCQDSPYIVGEAVIRLYLVGAVPLFAGNG
ncbi:hypothetical protein L195_g012643 [Trifolium pratense]|uniref:Uncharacterized protein n=1 Tax=Trifolium pratense TaxID=57577 RepID=A0A2K3PKZ5_TRIPR|nr:hypothetical protein L195_g012643 [Trifolium pratense]